MIEVVGISFIDTNKVYYFSPNSLNLKENVTVIVETEKGLQFGKVVTEKQLINEKKIKSPLKNVVRIATKKDYENNIKNIKDSKKSLLECRKLADKLKLNMQIIDASYTFNRDQLIFRFLADNRVDFRELAKQLASMYKTRIELRQIGVRDKAREIGGLAPCGKKLCCSQYSYDFNSVSINMAKNQNIALNPSKINGVCGRLLCCLKYEDENYSLNRKKLPSVGDVVKTEHGEGVVVSLDILNLKYKVDVKNYGIVEIKVKDES